MFVLPCRVAFARIAALGMLGVASLVVAACSSGTVVLTPQPKRQPTSAPTGTARPSPTPTPTSTASVALLPDAVVSTALASVGSYYATLPHANLSTDLQSLANQMVSSQQFKSAVVSPGGITATLPDGELTLVYADAPEEVDPTTSSAVRRQAALRPQSQLSFTGPPAPHSHIFLYDDADVDWRPDIDVLWAHALQNASFTNLATQQAIPNYSVSAVSVSLANMAGFGAGGYPLDYLSISTHGMIANVAPAGATSPQYQYYMQSTTPTSQRSQYVSDLVSRKLALAVTLVNAPASFTLTTGLAFSPAWLVSHMQFNTGAVVALGSCFGASPLVLGDNGTVFLNAKIGRWYGWTKAVGISDDYVTWSFALDRLIGEQNPQIDDMNQVATQRVPPQRPFSLDDIYTVMQTETRNSPLETKNEPYAVSDVGYAPNAAFPPASDGTAARLVVTDYGYENLTGAPAIYAMPSIGTMAVAEGPTDGTLTINGRFAPDPGGVAIVDATGQHPLTVSSWTTNQVTATINASGAGSAGYVQVWSTSDLAGIESNAVPLTQWTGVLNYQENDRLTNLDGEDGTGTGSLAATFNLTFRSDVHPTVPQIDTTPVPQNLYFNNVEAGASTAMVTALQGSFTSSEGTPPPATATLSLSQTSTLTQSALPLSQGHFIVGAFANQPIPCNDASPGPADDGATIFCPAFGYYPPFVGVCTQDPDDSGLCGGNDTFSPTGSFGAASLLDPGLVTFAMDPSSYAISVSGPDTMFSRTFNGDGEWPADATVTGTIQAPLYVPTSTTPALRTRGGLRVQATTQQIVPRR